MNAIIDQGNTFTKLFFFEKNKVEYFQRFLTQNFTTDDLFKLLIQNHIENIIISTVANQKYFDLDKIQHAASKVLIFNHKTPVPVNNMYKSPNTLGLDRLAAVVGAHNIFPGANVLVIDAGTAITFDFVDSSANYLGGNISPGLQTRFKALECFTGRLPLVEPSEDFGFLGLTTEEAIRNGVQNGLIFEIDGYISKMKAEYFDCKVILTGGDAIFLDKKLKNTIFAEPNLVAFGLNRILLYNEQNQ